MGRILAKVPMNSHGLAQLWPLSIVDKYNSIWADGHVTVTLTPIYFYGPGHSRLRLCWCEFTLVWNLFPMCMQLVYCSISSKDLAFAYVIFFLVFHSLPLFLSQILRGQSAIYLSSFDSSGWYKLEWSLNAGRFFRFCAGVWVHKTFRVGWSLMGVIVRSKACKKWKWNKADREREKGKRAFRLLRKPKRRIPSKKRNKYMHMRHA